MKVVLVSMTKPQVEQHINGVSHAKETVGVPVTEETLDNVKEVPVVMNEVSDPLKARFSPLRGKPATVSETPAPVKEYPTVLQDFLVPSNQSSFTLSESAPNLQETSSTSVESQFASTETSVDLKSPQLEYAPAPSEVPSLSDIESTNTDNILISHVRFFSSIVHVLLILFSLFHVHYDKLH